VLYLKPYPTNYNNIFMDIEDAEKEKK